MQPAQRSFISGTYWTERLGTAAALAAIRKHRREGVPAHLRAIGTEGQRAWREVSEEARVNVRITGMPALSFVAFDYPDGIALRTLFAQEVLDRGYLTSGGF
jgi:glutamate-1-semialdehyde 2,1-aminomutase